MAAAYSTIANDGEYIEPTFYKQVVNKTGKVIVEPEQETRRVFSESVSYVLKEGLTQPVLGNNGTARYCSISNMDVAAKTGTTDDNFDRWLCGFTPYYTAVTWFGYDQNETVNFNNQNPAGLIWANVMKSIHSNLSSKRFEIPDGVVRATICSETGLKATSGCPDTYIESFIKGTVPTLCKTHNGIEIKNTNNDNNRHSSQNQQNDEYVTNNDVEETFDNTTIDNEDTEFNVIDNNTVNSNINANSNMTNFNTINTTNTSNTSTNTNTNSNNISSNMNITSNTNINANVNTNSNVNTNTSSNNSNVNTASNVSNNSSIDYTGD